MLLKRLQQEPPAGHMYVLYLTTRELAPIGSIGPYNRNDLQDPNCHIIYWDTQSQELAVDTMQVENGKIQNLEDFLENRRVLWLTLTDADKQKGEEEILLSQSVTSYLDKQSCSVVNRYLWIAVIIAAVILLGYYLMKWMNAPPPSLPPRPVFLAR